MSTMMKKFRMYQTDAGGKFIRDARGKPVKREERLPLIGEKKVPCPVCGNPMNVSYGQIVYAHKKCKKKAKRLKLKMHSRDEKTWRTN